MVVGVCVKKHTSTKNAGHFMKWINPQNFFHCLAHLDLENFSSEFEVVVGGVKNHTWTKNAGHFMKWINPLKKFFSLFGPFGLRKFLIRVWGGGGVCEKSHLNQKCRKFHEMDKSTKKIFFSLFGPFGLRKFYHQSLRWWWWGCVWKSTPEPKMQEISWNG